MEQPTTIGIDLAKTVFQVHGVDAAGAAVVKRKLRRGQVLEVFARLSVSRRHGGLRRGALLGA